MPDWFRESFDELYLEIYAHRDLEEAARLVRTLGERVALPGARVLDIAAGAGRHLAAFRAAGGRPVGLDLSPALLRRAHATTAAAADLVRGDMRALPFADRTFDGAASLFTSFGYFEEDDENAGTLREAARVLRPGGWFVLDYLNAPRVVAGLVPASERSLPGFRVLETRALVRDGRAVRKEIRVLPLDGAPEGIEERHYREEVRLYDREEVVALLEAAGLEVREVAGDYDGNRFHPGTSPRLLAFTERRADPPGR